MNHLPIAPLALALNLLAALFMTGVIWFVQIVHYPLMAKVGEDQFADYERAHTRRASWIVIPPMAIELVTAMILALAPPIPREAWIFWTGFGMVALIWASTFFLQVPMHATLEKGFDAEAHAFLTGSNWIRVALWSARSLLMFYAFVRHIEMNRVPPFIFGGIF